MSMLAAWRDGPTREALIAFAETAAQTVPPEERVAVFDNDGTLWCEKPMPVELGFILQRLSVMAEADESLREKQPWKAAHEKDVAWLGGVMERHYAGDDADVKVLLGGVLAAFAGHTVEEYLAAAASFLDQATHPTLGRRLRDCWYCRWSSSSASWRDTASRATSPPAGAVTARMKSRLPPEAT